MLKPLFMEPYFNEKDWGGTRLARVYGKQIPSEHTGESWEVSAHPMGLSACEGRTLPQWIEEYGEKLTGTEVTGEFPLLIKLIDAREWLSVQVHPDDAYAQRVEGDPYGKTEAWVVLDCEPGAQLIFGIDCDVETLRSEIAQGRLEQHLKKVDVKPGDVLYIPAGTVHAIGANMLIYEVQQSSDRTYRLYAWGRNAQYAARFSVGDRISLTGRLQSREYQKLLENGEYMTRNAYEVSAFTLETAEPEVTGTFEPRPVIDARTAFEGSSKPTGSVPS